MTGVSERRVEIEQVGTAFGNARRGLRRGGIRRHHLAMGKLETLLQTRRQFHARGDGMFEPEGDEPFRETQRHQPLRRRARHLEHLRDLVLGVTGNEIEPAGTRGVIEPGLFILGGHGRRQASF